MAESQWNQVTTNQITNRMGARSMITPSRMDNEELLDLYGRSAELQLSDRLIYDLYNEIISRDLQLLDDPTGDFPHLLMNPMAFETMGRPPGKERSVVAQWRNAYPFRSKDGSVEIIYEFRLYKDHLLHPAKCFVQRKLLHQVIQMELFGLLVVKRRKVLNERTSEVIDLGPLSPQGAEANYLYRKLCRAKFSNYAEIQRFIEAEVYSWPNPRLAFAQLASRNLKRKIYSLSPTQSNTEECSQ
jgi:hypothetical protein